MRRKDREITQPEELLAILDRCDVCHLALHGGTFPYVVPLNFGVTREGEGVALWFHGAAAGKKLELLEENHHAAFSAACPGAVSSGGYVWAKSLLNVSLMLSRLPSHSAGLPM